jgi:hypothetical protein
VGGAIGRLLSPPPETALKKIGQGGDNLELKKTLETIEYTFEMLFFDISA